METFRASSYLRRNSIELQIPWKSIHACSEVGLGVRFVLVTLLLYHVLRPFQHSFKLMDLRYFEVSRHDHGDHSFGEIKKVWIVEDSERPRRTLKRAKLCWKKIPGFYESKDHVDQLTGRAVPPVIALQRNQHLARINSESGCLRNKHRKNCECCPGHYLSTSVYWCQLVSTSVY